MFFSQKQGIWNWHIPWWLKVFSGTMVCLLGMPSDAWAIKIAVLKLQTVEVDTSIAVYINDVIVQALQDDNYEIVTRTQQEKLLVQEQNCIEIPCAVVAGQRLGVDYAAIGKVYKLFGSYVLNIQVVDIKSPQNTKSLTKNITESLDSVRQAAQGVTQELEAWVSARVSQVKTPALADSAPLVGSRDSLSSHMTPSKSNAVIPPLLPISLSGRESGIPVDSVSLDSASLKSDAVPLVVAAPPGMIMIPGGEFTMGSGTTGDMPERKVGVDTFFIHCFEVTNREYAVFVKQLEYSSPVNPISPEYTIWSGGTYPAELENHPVVNVSWIDADAYCKWIGGRLPTEAEWEKAARGVSRYVYPWGNEWQEGRCNGDGDADGYAQTSPVGSFTSGASPFGVHDMCGNVAEWVADWYDRTYYLNAPLHNPLGPEKGTDKVYRGGSFADSPAKLISCRRQGVYPSFKDYNIGFRCVKDGK